MFYPGTISPIGEESVITKYSVQNERAYMPSAYMSVTQTINKKIEFEYGLRYSHYFNMGPYDLNMYTGGVPTTESDIIGVTHYNKGDVVAQYGGFEPRFSGSYVFDEKQSIKASYQHTRQYMHLISNTTSSTPTDIWKPAGYYVKPSSADQFVLGYFRNLHDNDFEVSVEGYYKKLYNLIDYRNGADLILNEHVETELLVGDGQSYGLEFLFSKKKGNLTGWIAYTLSKSTMQTPGFVTPTYTESETGVNNGDPYPLNSDKTHDVAVVAMYDLTDRWNISGNFIFITGRPTTYPNGQYVWDGKVVPDYNSRNESRIPSTNRLDISATYKLKNKGERWKHSIVFGLYNVYGRKNPYSVFFSSGEQSLVGTQVSQLSIIGIPVPFVTYNFSF